MSMQISTDSERDLTPETIIDDLSVNAAEHAAREHALARLQLLWDQRRMLCRVGILSFITMIGLAFLIPVRYTTITRLMPPDSKSTAGMAALALLGNNKAGSGAGALAGDLLGQKSTGDIFVGILQSRTVQ